MVSLGRLALGLLLLSAEAALAARLEIPLRVPFELMRQQLAARLTSYREGPCRYLNLGAPKLEALDGRLRLTGPGRAALGVELLGSCQTPVAWRGTLQFTLSPWIDGEGRLRLRIVDSTLGDAGGSTPGTGLIWDLSKRHVHPRLERFSYDLGASRAALAALLRGSAPPAQAEAMEETLKTLRVLEPRVEAAQIVVPIALEIPDAWLAAAPASPPGPSASSAPLTEAELEALEKSLEPWDAFLVYVVRKLARDNDDEALRKRLFTLLLDSRYRLVAILAGDAPAAGDPVRALFLEAWEEMRSILADSRYTLFIDGGDALVALEQAAPGMGLRFSTDGLRQLARSLQPGAGEDPLAYGWDVDSQLQQLFDIREPPPPPGTSWLDFLVRPAYAAAESLDQWVPTRAELAAYEARVSELLRRTAATELQRAALAAPYDDVYRNMVPTTALIESCWRQYVQRAGKAAYLRSPSGSVGLMQVNQHVWRGFYDAKRLRWDTAYNTRAGAQILMRYMKDYAIPYAEKTGDPSHVARAAYAVYNAGPRAVGRFNKKPPHPREQRVDEKLWTLYQGMASGGQADLASCGVRQGSVALK